MTFENRIDSLIAVFQADNNTDSLVTQNSVEIVDISRAQKTRLSSKLVTDSDYKYQIPFDGYENSKCVHTCPANDIQ